MKYQDVMEYLEYTGLAEAHPELVRLYRENEEQWQEYVEDLNDSLDAYMEMNA